MAANMQSLTPPKPSSLKPETTIAQLPVQLDLANVPKDKYDIEALMAFQRL